MKVIENYICKYLTDRTANQLARRNLNQRPAFQPCLIILLCSWGRHVSMTLSLSVQEYARVFNIRSRKSSLVSLFTNSFTFTLNFQFVVCLSRLGIWTNISILVTDQLYQYSWDQSTIQIKEKRTSHFIQNSRHIYRGNCKQYIKLITIKQTMRYKTPT